ncbi:hypothetical protein D3C81_2045020 [compost metagenome]
MKRQPTLRKHNAVEILLFIEVRVIIRFDTAQLITGVIQVEGGKNIVTGLLYVQCCLRIELRNTIARISVVGDRAFGLGEYDWVMRGSLSGDDCLNVR